MKKYSFSAQFSIVFFVLLLGFTVPITGQTYGPNLISNGDFELSSIFPMPNPPVAPNAYTSGTWYRNNTKVIKEITYPITTTSVYFNSDTGNDAAMYQRTTGLEVNTTYKITATARMQSVAGAPGGTTQGFMYVDVRGGTYWGQSTTNLATGISFNSSSNTTKSFEFNTGSNTDIVVMVVVWKTAWGKGYFDDFKIEKKLATITTTFSDVAMGTVTSFGTVNWGSNTSVTATPNTGYHFVNWTENGTQVSTNATYNFTASADRNLVANFEPDVVTIASGTSNASDISFTTSDVTVSAGATLIVNASKTFKSITVAPGAKLTLNNTCSLSTTNGITLQNTADGTASFLDSRTEDFPTSIAGTVEQTITGTSRNWYVALPVTGKVPEAITLVGASVLKRNETSASWETVSVGTPLLAGVGYVAVASASIGNATWTLAGNLHSGKVEVNVTRSGATATGFNLLGNPYPSYLNWEQVLNLNATNASTLQPTIWYRTATYNTELGKYDYTFNTYNSTSRIATPTSTTGYIPPMQAFWVRANNAGTVTFTNAMRSHGDGTSNKLKAQSVNNQKIVRLQVANSTNITDETVLYFDENALNAFDKYDSEKMFSNSASKPEIFTQVGSDKLVINGLNAIPYNTELPIGFSTLSSGNFRISGTEITNLELGTRILLKDKMNPAIEFELSEGVSYNFSAGVTPASTDRFSLIFRSAGNTTDIKETAKPNIQVFVNAANKIVLIAPENSNYAIYNTAGQLIENGVTNVTSKTLNAKLSAGVYVVKIGNTTSRVIVN